MKPIKCWVAQDSSDAKLVYCYGAEKPIKFGDYWGVPETYCLGENLLGKNKSPVKCVIITEQHYKELLEEARLK